MRDFQYQGNRICLKIPRWHVRKINEQNKCRMIWGVQFCHRQTIHILRRHGWHQRVPWCREIRSSSSECCWVKAQRNGVRWLCGVWAGCKPRNSKESNNHLYESIKAAEIENYREMVEWWDLDHSLICIHKRHPPAQTQVCVTPADFLL